MTMVNITVAEYESNEAMAAVVYPMELAGVTVWAVPVFETAVGREATAEEKYRIVDLGIQPIKASKRSWHAHGECGGIELE